MNSLEPILKKISDYKEGECKLTRWNGFVHEDVPYRIEMVTLMQPRQIAGKSIHSTLMILQTVAGKPHGDDEMCVVKHHEVYLTPLSEEDMQSAVTNILNNKSKYIKV